MMGTMRSVSAGSGEELTSWSLWGGECLCSTLGVCGSEMPGLCGSWDGEHSLFSFLLLFLQDCKRE